MTNARARLFARGFAISGALPLLLIFAISAFSEIPNYWDPCFVWGYRGGQTISIRSGDPCQSVSGTSETRVGALGRLVLVQGTGVVAALLGLVGALSRTAAGRSLGSWPSLHPVDTVDVERAWDHRVAVHGPVVYLLPIQLCRQNCSVIEEHGLMLRPNGPLQPSSGAGSSGETATTASAARG